jgi:hypothetical protein
MRRCKRSTWKNQINDIKVFTAEAQRRKVNAKALRLSLRLCVSAVKNAFQLHAFFKKRNQFPCITFSISPSE